ncbi:MAG: succinate dehydrogenase, cytochrome b556 subunit [Alphaproteobacteria bacterium]|nr:succinate dehydrogenase, cytochrome b556 subunit [Alphaproteobacteria bacterium]
MSDSKPKARPLSPHLQIYRPMLSTAMSIFHRITGVALALGMIGLAWWFTAASVSDAYFGFVQGFFYHWFGRLILFGFTWALIHHMLGGFRHFIWDTGRGFELKTVEWLVRANLFGSILLTILIWVIGYGVRA